MRGLEHLRRPTPGSGSGTAAVHLTAQASRPGFKVVRFDGYTMRVPASWPVYRLDRDPSRCVRYDRHAVYLGRPGANQLCPAHLVGRTATISIQAADRTPGPASSVADTVGTGAAIGDLAAGRRVGDPRCPGSGDGHRARGPRRISHRDLHRGRPRGAGHPAQPAAGRWPPHPRRRRTGPGPGDEGLRDRPALRARRPPGRCPPHPRPPGRFCGPRPPCMPHAPPGPGTRIRTEAGTTAGPGGTRRASTEAASTSAASTSAASTSAASTSAASATPR